MCSFDLQDANVGIKYILGRGEKQDLYIYIDIDI